MNKKIFFVVGIFAFGWIIFNSFLHFEGDGAKKTTDLYKNTYILAKPEDVNKTIPSINSGDHGPILLPPHDPQQPIGILKLK